VVRHRRGRGGEPVHVGVPELEGRREVLTELLTDPDREKSRRVMGAMLKMKRIEIGELERAAAQT
jgi:hypothetical protein